MSDFTVDDVLPVARAYVTQWRDDYDAAVKEWYETGDGSPSAEGGRGHRYPECIHGSSLWTDYDNICGGCEDGEDDYLRALRIAERVSRNLNERTAWTSYRPTDLPHDLAVALIEWAFAPLKAIQPRSK